jgi:hypothetical protein
MLSGTEAGQLGVKIERNVPVPMRDGVILRADVYRPDRGGPYPVLVQRTPYGKSGLAVLSDMLAGAGYIVVCQDVRGRYESEGRFEYELRQTTHDAEDGYDTVEWAAKLPGSTGKVGTLGTSYPAGLQWRLAPLRPPSLVAMSACSCTAHFWDMEGPHTIRPGYRLEWFAMMATDMRRRENLLGVQTAQDHQKRWWQEKEGEKWIQWLPWLDLPDDFFGHETDALKSWLRNPPVDTWRLEEGCKEIAVPNFEIVGWYDSTIGDMLLFRTMVKGARTEVARKGSRIIIGPWGHGDYSSRFGKIDFGRDAALYLGGQPLQLRWFDYWLKGMANGVDKDALVKMFVMGDNQWRDERSWPLQRAKERVLFIASQGHANTPSGDGILVDTKPEHLATDKYVYDPRDPVPTPFGARMPVPADQRPLANRKDILAYQTEPIQERIEVTGNPVVELYAASSAPDTDWFVKLIDVAPDGLARDAASGLVRARYRHGFDKAELITPGEVVKYTIRMGPTSNAFLPGHRLRLDITSSDFPNYDRNHNTAANQNADATLAVANQTVYHGGPQATRIILPWVPNPTAEESLARRMSPFPQVPALPWTAGRGDLARVKELLEKGADVNTRIIGRQTALHIASANGHKEIVELLLAHSADVNAAAMYNRTAAEEAMKGGHTEIVELLISKGADISPLHFALYMKDQAKAKSLIESGADVNKRTPNGTTPLSRAADIGFKDIAELLIAKGANVNAKSNWDWTPLHSAAENGHKDMVDLLVAKGADVNARDGGGWTPLSYARQKGHKEITEVLRKHGAKE